jgi:cardiolipin synthase
MFQGGLLGHILSVATFLLTLLLVSILIRSRRPPGSTIAWLAVIAMVPYIGIPFFLLFGRRKIIRSLKNPLYQPRPDRMKSAEGDLSRIRMVLLGSGAPDPASNSEFTFLESGEDTYNRLLKEIRSAKKSIDIAVFIFSRDEVGKAILNELSKKAQEGVTVRLLVDAWGSSILVRPSFGSLKKAGGKVAYFLPLLHIPFRGNTNLRNHRKVAVFDEQKAWFGGMNFAKEYLGPTPYSRRWKDLSIAIEGGSVGDLADIFESDWAFATGKAPQKPKRAALAQFNQERIAQVVASGPDALQRKGESGSRLPTLFLTIL